MHAKLKHILGLKAKNTRTEYAVVICRQEGGGGLSNRTYDKAEHEENVDYWKTRVGRDDIEDIVAVTRTVKYSPWSQMP